MIADLSRGGLCIVGPNRSGLTTALVTVADMFAGHVAGQSPALVCFDGSDQLSHDLSERFANVVSMPLTRLDYVTRCVDQLWLMMRSRMERSQGKGSANYRGAFPVLLLIDGFDLLARSFASSTMGQWAGRLMELLTLGRRQGIYTCITTRRLRDIEASVISSQATIINLHAHYEGSNVPQENRLAGFGLDADGNLLQIYFPPPAPDHPSEAFPKTSLTEFLEPEGWRHNAVAPSRSPLTDLTVELGVDELDRRPLTVSLSETHLLIIGGPRSGRTTALLRLAHELSERSGRPVALFSPRGLPHGALTGAIYPLSSDDLLRIHAVVRDSRAAELANLGCASLKDGRLVLLIDDSYAIESMDRGDMLNGLLGELYKHSLIQPVAATAASWINGSQLTGTIKSSGVTMYLKPTADRSEFDDGYRVRGISLRHRPGIVYRGGDAIVQTDEAQYLVHLPLVANSGEVAS